jgi:hypothetical protein
MTLDRAHTQEQPLGDLLVAEPLGDERRQLAFSSAQISQCVRGHWSGAEELAHFGHKRLPRGLVGEWQVISRLERDEPRRWDCRRDPSLLLERNDALARKAQRRMMWPRLPATSAVDRLAARRRLLRSRRLRDPLLVGDR